MFRNTINLIAVVGSICLSSLVCGQAIDLTVDQSQSSITFTVAGSSDTSSITGTGAIELVPPFEPFSTAQITELEITIADGISISFLGGLVSISADPNETVLSLTQPGLPGNVNGANQFDQLENFGQLTGTVDLFDPFNLAGGSQTIDLAEAGPGMFDIIGAQLNVVGDFVTVTSMIDITVDATDDIAVDITGTVVMTGKLPSFQLGDVNCDGIVDLLDIAPFVALISSGGFSDKADLNQDGFVNLLDIGPFITFLTGQ